MTSHDEFIGTQGWVMRHIGAFPVNTRRPTPGVVRHCRELAQAGELVVIFPEGTIFYYPPDNVHPLKPGTAWLALDCQDELPDVTLRVIPIRIIYNDRYPRFRTRVRIAVREEIPLGPYLGMARKPAIRDLTARLQAALGDVVNDSLAEMAPPRSAEPEPAAPTHV
jgi:1-acyl-sn-glycerol-3-phosphate acyltransferase